VSSKSSTASSINWWFANIPLKGAVTDQLRIEDGTVSSKEKTPKYYINIKCTRILTQGKKGRK
jgi:hypothetical protein